jgi:hypothetical protein
VSDDTARDTAPGAAGLRDQIAEALRHGILLRVDHQDTADLADEAADDVLAVPALSEALAEAEQLRGEKDAATLALLHVLDAVKAHGDKAAINAAHAALAQVSAGKVVDERNELRRQVVDLRDELAIKDDRDAKHEEASELAAQRTTAELRLEDTEAAIERVRAEMRRWQDPGAPIYAPAMAQHVLAALSPAGGSEKEEGDPNPDQCPLGFRHVDCNCEPVDHDPVTLREGQPPKPVTDLDLPEQP